MTADGGKAAGASAGGAADRGSSPRRKGSVRRADIPADVLDGLHSGALQTATLIEQLALDFGRLTREALPDADPRVARELDAMADAPVTGRMRRAGELLHETLGDTAFEQLRAHRSDTVRAWSAFALVTRPRLTLNQGIKLLRPLADDDHFCVREWAWLALRPQLVAAPLEAIQRFEPWTSSRSENLRRFASEATRPRGVWCKHIAEFKQDPALGLPVLEPLRADPSRYVRDSVANWINDATRTRPGWVRDVCARWTRESPCDETAAIVKRATRTLK